MLQAAIECLRDQQTVLGRLKSCAHNAAQPVYRIPDEVLAGVFEYGAPGVSSVWNFAPPTSGVATWYRSQFFRQRSSIGATCSHFRDVLLNTPRCWSNVSCAIDTYGRGNTSLVALKVWLARSRNCQLDLRVSIVMDQERMPSVSELEAVSRILLPHMHRCRSLHFTSNDFNADFPLLIPQSALENLKHVEFDWGDSETWHEPGQAPLDTSKADASMISMITATRVPLQSLLIARVDSHIDLRTIDVQALTRLRIYVHSTRVVLQLLRHCAVLEHLDWTMCGTDEKFEDAPDPVHLDNLISLRVTGYYEMEKPCILYAPRLQQIRLHCEDVSDLPFDIVRHNHPTLHFLDRAQITHSYNPALPAFLRRHPHLTICLVYVEDLVDNSDITRIRAVLESLLPNGRPPRMQYFLLWFNKVNASMWERVKPTVELVLDELPELHISLRIGPWVGEEPRSFCAEFGSRISIEGYHPRLSSAWRDAWDKPSLMEW